MKGETDSERFFALITKEIERDGDIGGAIVRATRWIAENLPVFALNVVLITANDLWALRYPDVHELFVLERAAGGPTGAAPPRARQRPRVGARALRRSAPPGRRWSSPASGWTRTPGWRPLESGELLHVDPDLKVTITKALDPTPGPPAHARRPRRQGRGLAGASQVAMATVTRQPSVAPPAPVEPRLPPGPRLPRVLQTVGFMLTGPVSSTPVGAATATR